jgi:hypothetical protein
MQFNFFGRLTLSIHTQGHAGYERYFSNEYRRITRAVPAECDDEVSVFIVSAFPPGEPGDIRRAVNCKGLFTFEYLIRDVPSKNVRIYFKRHFMDRIYMNAVAVFLQAQVLEPIMYLKFLQQNMLFMHAGGVCDNQYGYVFPAHGGTGKTTFSIALLNHGYRLLGDDLLIIDVSEGVVYPYPRPLHLFTYNINHLYGASVPLKYRVTIYIKNLLRFVLERTLRTEFLISTRVHADELFSTDPFGAAVPLGRMFFLVKEGEAATTETIDSLSIGRLAQEIMESADLNASLYELLQDANAIEAVKRSELAVIHRLLSRFDVLTKINTRNVDLSDMEQFVRTNFAVPRQRETGFGASPILSI